MTQAIVDPEHVRRFARELHVFNEELHDRMTNVRGMFTGLGETWRDQEHAKFKEEFERTMFVLEAFRKVVDQHIPFLLRKAEAAQDYLDRR